MAFVINTGAVRVPLEDNFGRVFGYAVYVPTDVGIIDRYRLGSHYLDEMAEAFKNIDPKTVTGENAMELLKLPKEKLKEFCDFVFGNGFYDSAFANIDPFAGEEKFVCVQIIEGVLNDIKERQEQRKQKEAKYLKGYSKNA